MGLFFSLLVSHAKQLVIPKLYGLPGKSGVVIVRSLSFDMRNNGETMVREVSFKKRDSNLENADDFDGRDEVVIQETRQIDRTDHKKLKLETTVSFKSLFLDGADAEVLVDKFKYQSNPITLLPEPEFFFSPRPVNELDAAAVKVQKVYKSYRTRRNLADCAVVVEELWWKALDFAALKKSSVSFFEKPETAVSRWARARTRAAKVGKGLSKNEKAQKLALRHWLEAIDPRHRYGHNLHMYYAVWFASESFQPFFYWLDVGDGKEVNLDNCPRTVLQHQCIKYLGPKEREAYEVIVEGGKLIYKQNREFVDTTEGSKWIFVLSTLRSMYVAEKKKGLFQHSSFLAGGATTASGRLVAHNGVLEAIWPYSGHYCPTEEHFMEFITFLEDHRVDLTNVKRCSVDEDQPPSKAKPEFAKVYPVKSRIINNEKIDTNLSIKKNFSLSHVHVERNMNNVFESGKCAPRNWTTGTGARTGCVRDYPTDLQFQALEQVNLLPRTPSSSVSGCNVPVPIPSPRPIPNVHLSPKLAHMGFPSPRLVLPPGSC